MLDETEDEQPVRVAGQTDNVIRFDPAKRGKPGELVSFTRRELDQILRIYGHKVAAGEWRDYAIDMLKDRAVFSVFRRSTEVPLYLIEKNPRLARRQGAYCVTSAAGHVLRRGQELAGVLKFFDKRPRLAAV
ncbi:MAG: hypothetical protein BroJett030_13920 [Alphaproteobacteria bacterium]|nr:MAG: hypothetical protein BroJett030_13920 [Alphaproteobacteria bacterium]